MEDRRKGLGLDSDMMSRAFLLAREALEVGEVPVGCVMVYKNEIVAQGRNHVNESKNACRHAEFECVDQVISWCKKKQLKPEEVFPGITVFVTVEPCIMCASAIKTLGISRLVFGCSNDRFGGCGSVLDIFEDGVGSVEVCSGFRANEAIDLLKTFYMGENPNAPVPKPKANRRRRDAQSSPEAKPVVDDSVVCNVSSFHQQVVK
ncbi:tRNA-specific adenosine deaminase 2-like [Ornithodoros turicata]|uniref:tRNA-specific adenosine deaminase 2-like n=1 Tax=Ornithodoros turicata TaxID=34597 RepID=UPI0031389127